MAEPKIRFRRDDGNSFPEWKMTLLSDIFERVNERNHGQFDKTKWISVAKMYYQEPDKVQSNNIDTRTYIMRYGDIAFEGHPNAEFMYGRFVVNDIGDGIISELFPIYRHKKAYILQYWKYAIQVEKIMAPVYRHAITSSGASSNKLKEEDFLKESIPVPCYEEQQKIADFLSSVDEVISTSEQEVANLETQKKAVMNKIFSQEVRFKREDGTDFPEWEQSSLDNLTERIIVGLATTVTPYYRPTGIPMIRNLNIKAGYLDDNDIIYLDEEYASKQVSKYVHAGDILTVHTGNIGWSCIAPDAYEGALSFTTLITTLKTDNLYNSYVCSYLNTDLGMKQMQDLAFSGGRANLNVSEFQKVVLPIPCIEEQHLIADFLSDFDKAIVAAKKELGLWKKLKMGLLQQMFV